MRTLMDMREELIDRLNFASQAASDNATVRLANSFLRNAQAQLYWQYDFPELRYKWTIALVAGTVSYAWPTNVAGADGIAVEPRRLVNISVADGATRGPPLREGITPSMYSNAVSGIPTHYEGRGQIEFWRTPDQAYTAHLDGFRKLKAFATDADVCTVDDELVFMLALANGKAHYRQADAEIYAREMNAMLARLKGAAHGGRRYIPGHNDGHTAAAKPRDAAP